MHDAFMLAATNTSARYQVRAYIKNEGDSIEATYRTRAEAQAHADRIAGRTCHSASVVEVAS